MLTTIHTANLHRPNNTQVSHSEAKQCQFGLELWLGFYLGLELGFYLGYGVDLVLGISLWFEFC